MAYQHDRELQLTYEPGTGFFHFVLYTEPPGSPGAAINAGHAFDASTSRYAAEWLARLEQCDPDALHVTLVGSRDAPSLWHPCVYEDQDSPSAIARDGCVCWQTYRDPITWMPVAAHHYRTVSGNIENWQQHTLAPLGLPAGERLAALVIDRESHMFWVRTDQGTLHILPEKAGAGYEVGYGGGGPTELTRMIEKIVGSDGHDVTPGTRRGMPNRKAMNWIRSPAADQTQELALDQLRTLCRTGMVG